MGTILNRRARRVLDGGSAGSGGGGYPPAATLVPAWWQDYVTGNDNNSGTDAAHPVQNVREIVRRWQGGIAGVRPQLSVSTVIHIGSPVPVSKFDDPLVALANVDLGPNVVVTVQPTTPIVKRSGVVTSIANVFARTPTGQLQIHDAGVVDWTSDVDHLFIDTTQGASSWVTTPTAGNGVLSAVRPTVSPLTGIDPTLGLGNVVTVAPGDLYQILTPLSVYFGTGSLARGYPSDDSAATSSVIFYGLHGVAQNVNDLMNIDANYSIVDTITALAQSGATVQFCQCNFDVSVQSQRGGVFFVNCAAQDAISLASSPGSTSAALAGYGRNTTTLGGYSTIDQDFSLIASDLNAFYLAIGQQNFMGDASIYNAGCGTMFSTTQGSSISIVVSYDPTLAVVYGAVNPAGNICFVDKNSFVRYDEAQSAAATFQLNVVTFSLDGEPNSWGFNETTGLYVGPTTPTIAHLDAPLGAGTGFNHVAVDPRSLSFMGRSVG